VLEPDGEIVAAGGDALIRFASDGSVDNSLGTAGVADFGAQLQALSLDPAGKVIVAGRTERDMIVGRFDGSGASDATFGSGGRSVTSFPANAYGEEVLLQPDGKIVAAGTVVGTDSAFGLVRYAADGSIDSSFGSGGMSTTAVGGEDLGGLLLQPDGKIVAAGSDGVAFGLARVNPDGSSDTSFGSGGTVTTPITGLLYAATLAPDGKIIVAGGSAGAFLLVRYTASGSLDTSFGSGGVVSTPFGTDSRATAVTVQPDGKIVAAGVISPALNSYDFGLVRYQANGSLDTTFGSAGIVTTDLGGVDTARAVGLQPDGKIMAAGSTGNSLAATRYNPDGSLDASFDGDGKVTAAVQPAAALVIQPDGKLVVVGPLGGQTYSVTRLNANGALDTSFGSGGTVTGNGNFLALALQADGKLVAFGLLTRSTGFSSRDSPALPRPTRRRRQSPRMRRLRQTRTVGTTPT
jgi:uncharacterized delta-60 repeat protein